MSSGQALPAAGNLRKDAAAPVADMIPHRRLDDGVTLLHLFVCGIQDCPVEGMVDHSYELCRIVPEKAGIGIQGDNIFIRTDQALIGKGHGKTCLLLRRSRKQALNSSSLPRFLSQHMK